MFRMDSGLLNDPLSRAESVSPEHVSIRFVTFTLGYWITRCRDALWHDRDLFPQPRVRRPALLPDSLLMVDLKTKAEAWHRLKQSGHSTANEGRPHFGLPPHPEGDVLQETPVGGAPNPTSDAGLRERLTVNLPAIKQAPITVHVPEREVHIPAPEVRVDVAAPHVDVAAPDVTVNPDVHVAPSIIHVDVPSRAPRRAEFVRDERGRITGIEESE